MAKQHLAFRFNANNPDLRRDRLMLATFVVAQGLLVVVAVYAAVVM